MKQTREFYQTQGDTEEGQLIETSKAQKADIQRGEQEHKADKPLKIVLKEQLETYVTRRELTWKGTSAKEDMQLQITMFIHKIYFLYRAFRKYLAECKKSPKYRVVIIKHRFLKAVI